MKKKIAKKKNTTLLIEAKRGNIELTEKQEKAVRGLKKQRKEEKEQEMENIDFDDYDEDESNDVEVSAKLLIRAIRGKNPDHKVVLDSLEPIFRYFFERYNEENEEY